MKVKLNNTEINCKIIEGDTDKPVLVFLHEGLGCIEMWKTFPEKLCMKTGCQALLYDRSGYGLSSPFTGNWTTDYHRYYALEELPALLEAVMPSRDIILFGHSDGATVALIYASSKPSVLRGMVLEAPHVFVEEETVSGVREAVNAFNEGKLDKLHKYHGEKTNSIFSAWSGLWTDINFRKWNIENLLPSVDVPHLVIQGDMDRYGTEKQYNAIKDKTAGITTVSVIKDCGHSPHITKQQDVTDIAAGYIKALNQA